MTARAATSVNSPRRLLRHHLHLTSWFVACAIAWALFLIVREVIL